MTSSIDIVFFCHDSGSENWHSREFLDKLIKLDLNYFPNPWSSQNWLDLMIASENYFLVTAQHGDDIVGFALFKLSPLEELAHLLKIMVVPEKRGRHLGVALMRQSLENLKRFQVSKYYLEVEATNSAAIALYEQFSFCRIHKISNFYGQSKDALIMVRE